VFASKHREATQISPWKRRAVEGLSGVFTEGGKSQGPSDSEINDLHVPLTGSGLLANHER